MLAETKGLSERETFDWFKDRVKHHRSKAKELHKFRDYQKALDLLEDVTSIEIEILKKFGLPETFEFISIIDLFSWREEIDDFDVEELFGTLKETAECFLLSAAKSDVKILIEAKERHLTANDFFAMIGVDSNMYNVFLYETLFYTNDFDAASILFEMKKGNTIAPEMAVKMNSGLLLKRKLDETAKEIGLQFWDEFVEQKKTEKQNPRKKAVQYIDIVHNGFYGIFPTAFAFDAGFLHSIEYCDDENNTVLVELVTSVDLSMLPILVYMPFDEVVRLLKKTTNHAIAANVRTMLFEWLKGNGEYANRIQIRAWHRTYLYFSGFDLTVKKCRVEKNGIPVEEHNLYEMTIF